MKTDHFLDMVGTELQTLPGNDKTKHFAVSYAIALLYSEHFVNTMFPTSLCIMKAALDSFKVGLRKEYADKGLDFAPVSEKFDKIVEILASIYSEYEKNGLSSFAHESDLLANLAGIGTYMINQSLRSLDDLYEQEKE